jgi:hypothetical protein
MAKGSPMYRQQFEAGSGGQELYAVGRMAKKIQFLPVYSRRFQLSKVDREFNSMNIQRRNVSSERIRILFSSIHKDFPQTILCHQI